MGKINTLNCIHCLINVNVGIEHDSQSRVLLS